MKFLLICLSLMLTSIHAMAKDDVKGIVIDSENKEPLVGASIIIKDSNNKILKFTISDKDGSFQLSCPSVAGCLLEVSMMGFEKKSIPLDNTSFPITITLSSKATQIKEVAIKSKRIYEQGDTISYHVSSFAQAQDRSVGDVLKRMPGIEVSNSGKIQYQGDDINKFYIEGSDLLGGKYGLATNGINHENVGAVEVLENHQPLQVLSGFSFSDKAAINIKLKNKAKATWNVHGHTAGGWAWQPEGAIWDGDLFTMCVTPQYQNMTTLRTNNTGEDLSASSTDFFANRRETGLNPYIAIGLPQVAALDHRHTYFNRSFLVSSNNLWKFGRGEIKTNIDYSFNRITANASNITTYFLDEGNHVVTENRDGIEHQHALNGKFIYELNQKKAFISNILQTHIDWNNIDLCTTGSISNTQSADLPNYYVSNQFKLIKRFKDKHLVTFESRNEWESLPQTLRFDLNGKTYDQNIGDHAFYTHESAAYAFSFKGIMMSLEGGIKGFWRSMNSHLNDLPTDLPALTENVVHTNSFTVYATPSLEYWIKRVNIKLNLPISYAHYSFDKAIANRDEVYFAPSLSLNWKPNNHFSGMIRGGIGRSPMNLNLIHTGLIMTDYRTLKSGVEHFYNTSSQSISANLKYKHTRYGLFANAAVLHSWSHIPYTLSQQLFGDYVVYHYADATNNSKTLFAFGNIGKTLDFMRGSCNINGSYNRTESRLLSQQEFVQSVGSSWSITSKIIGSPWRWFNFDYEIGYSQSRLTLNGGAAPWLSAMTNKLNLNFTPHNKWQWTITGENYRNELTKGSFKNITMLDTKLSFRATKRLEIASSVSNILNKKQYNYTTYSQLSSFESQRRLRGRQFIISISLRK